ncbi:hypothetical protein M9Y10_041134 [Tritrichomonas musculus]|uniref:Cleavage/polyadenylation specificity factor A subunit C-terminal domain-containing protein n=1 Tax=Tritrichomonas musculus TaxID=1915356 RepID=A0ABR2K3J1_9EUKA
MFGHACEEPIALFCPHPWNNQIILCTTKHNLILLDIFKNRSIRNFSVSSNGPKEAQQAAAKSSPIGLFFVDNISCRAYQSILKSTIQQLPSDYYICLVFPRGLILWNHTICQTEWVPLNFTATCVVQTPDSLILGDNGNRLYQISLIDQKVKEFAKIQGNPNNLFLTTYAGDQYGILAISSPGAIDFISASGKVTAQVSCDIGKSIAFDVFTNALYIMTNKKTVHVYSISPNKVEKVGECSFSGVTAGDTKPTNYTVQQIAPCRLPLSPKPLFYAICESQTLLIGGASKVVQKVDSFPAVRTLKKLNCSLMLSHPTDLAVLMLASEGQFFALDMYAHLPHVVPSLAIPDFIPPADRFDGIYTVSRNSKLICLMNHSNETYTVFDAGKKSRIITRSAIDVIAGPGSKYAELKVSGNSSQQGGSNSGASSARGNSGRESSSSSKRKKLTIEVYDAEKSTNKTIPVVPPRELDHPMRLISFGDFFAVIVAKHPLDLSFNMQQRGRTQTLVYSWSTYDPIALQFDGCSMIAFEPPYIALASPNSYAVFDTEHQMQLKVRREKRVLHFKFFEGKLFLLTIYGLEVDNFRTVELVSSRFSHLITKEKNAPVIPMNAVMIKEVLHDQVTVLDISGNQFSLGIPEERQDDERAPLIVKVALAPDPLKAASNARKTASHQQMKGMMLMMMKAVGWEKVLDVLSESEKAASEIAAREGGTRFQEEFQDYLTKELEIE